MDQAGAFIPWFVAGLPVLMVAGFVILVLFVVSVAMGMNQIGPHHARGLLAQEAPGQLAERPPGTDWGLVAVLLVFIGLTAITLVYMAVLAPFGIGCLLMPVSIVVLFASALARRGLVQWARAPLLGREERVFVQRARRVRFLAGPRLGLALDAHVARVEHGPEGAARIARGWFRRQWVRPREEQEMVGLVLEDLARRGDWETVEVVARAWTEAVPDAALLHCWLGRALLARGAPDDTDVAEARLLLARELDDRAGFFRRRVDHHRDA